MTFDDKFIQEAIIRINQLQEDIRNKAYKVEGAKEYIEKQVKLFEQEELKRYYLKKKTLKGAKWKKVIFIESI